MINGFDALNGSFLADLNRIESRISTANQRITSGIRVAQPSDDPSAIEPILAYQGQIDQINQIQSNLSLSNTDATTADGALQTASNLLDQLVTIAGQGASTPVTSTTRSILSQQVQQIEQQLVSIANTTVRGRYIFGGDDPSTQPYTFNWSSPLGVISSGTPSNTSTIRDFGGSSIVPGMTASQIFNATNPDGTLASGNIFQAAYSLGQALQNNDEAGIQNAAGLVKDSVAYLGSVTAFYGNTETWIQQAQSDASQRLTSIQQSLSGFRDTDVAATITQLTSDQAALQVSISAHASLNQKSLFDYLA